MATEKSELLLNGVEVFQHFGIHGWGPGERKSLNTVNEELFAKVGATVEYPSWDETLTNPSMLFTTRTKQIRLPATVAALEAAAASSPRFIVGDRCLDPMNRRAEVVRVAGDTVTVGLLGTDGRLRFDTDYPASVLRRSE